jgi:hypothetical protein
MKPPHLVIFENIQYLCKKYKRKENYSVMKNIRNGENATKQTGVPTRDPWIFGQMLYQLS